MIVYEEEYVGEVEVSTPEPDYLVRFYMHAECKKLVDQIAFWHSGSQSWVINKGLPKTLSIKMEYNRMLRVASQMSVWFGQNLISYGNVKMQKGATKRHKAILTFEGLREE